jgi:hypothetical protein
MLRRQTTTENELREGSKGVDTTLSGVLVLNYRLENFIMTPRRLYHSVGYLKAFSLSSPHTHTHIYKVSFPDKLHYFHDIIYGPQKMMTL